MIIPNVIPRVPLLLVLLLQLLLLTKLSLQLVLVLEVDVHVLRVICLVLTVLQNLWFVQQLQHVFRLRLVFLNVEAHVVLGQLFDTLLHGAVVFCFGAGGFGMVEQV